MLELIGSEYVIDHVLSEHRSKTELLVYRYYTSDVLKAIAEGWCADVPYRYRDLINPSYEEEINADEIALDIIQRAGLEVSR